MPPPMGVTRLADTVIIGGGIHGCSAALHLALRGLSVILLEKDHCGRHASGVNAGGVRRLGRALPEVPLSVASMEMWHRIADLVEDDCGFESHGQIKIAENDADLAKLQSRAELLNAHGFTHEEIIDQSELREVVPAVAPHCVGALISRADGAALPFQTVQAFRRKAESLGVQIREGARAVGLRRNAGRWEITMEDGSKIQSAHVVNAAGAWAGHLAAAVGEPVPLKPIAPMLMITERINPFLAPVVGATSRPLSFKQYGNGTVLIGGGYRGRAIPEENRTELNYAGLCQNARTATDLFPIMRNVRINRVWAGIEALMPDEIPVVGPSGTEEGLWHAFGFSAHGFQLGPVVGSLIASLIATGHTNLPIAPFSITRFHTSQA